MNTVPRGIVKLRVSVILLTYKTYKMDFYGGRTPEHPKKKSRSKARSNSKLNPHMTPSRNRTRAWLTLTTASFQHIIYTGTSIHMDRLFQLKYLSYGGLAEKWQDLTLLFQAHEKDFRLNLAFSVRVQLTNHRLLFRDDFFISVFFKIWKASRKS